MPKNKPRRVFAVANMPARPPLGATLVLWLLLDRLQPPGWVWGATSCAVLFLWLVWGHDVATRHSVSIDDLLNKKD